MNTFSELCSGRYFTIPENQRGFSWQKRNVDDLINDLELAGQHSHYMGPIIVSRTSQPDFQDDHLSTTAEFTLEDGQQRLTTFFIFANEIRKRLLSAGGQEVEAALIERMLFYNKNGQHVRIRNQNPQLEQYLSFILTGAPEPPADLTRPMEAMREVKEAICAYLDTSENPPNLVMLKQRLTNQAKFIWVDLAAEGVNRYLAFDAINSRGLPLSEFDKIKNFCVLIKTVRSLEMHPEKSWYSALVQLQHFEVSTRSDEAAFITDLHNTYHNEKVTQDNVHDSFVDRYRDLLKGPNEQLQDELIKFVDLWEKYAKSFGFVTSKKKSLYYGNGPTKLCASGAGAWLDRLDNMNLATICRALLTASHMNLSKEDFEEAARSCEIYTFRAHGTLRLRKDANAKSLLKTANGVLRGADGIDDIKSDLCGLLIESAPMSRFIERLADGKPKYNFAEGIPGWEQCYYFLYEYEVYCSPHGVSPLPWATDKNSKLNTQEHILPQSYRNQEWWSTHWPVENLADKYLHRLGNLVLTANNTALGAKDIQNKLIDPNGGYCYTHLNATNTEKLIPQFTDGTEWKKHNILLREGKMLEFAVKRWSIPCSADNGDIQLPEEFGDPTVNLPKITVSCENCYPLAADEEGEDEVEDTSGD